MLSWEEVNNNFKKKSISFAGLCDEDLIKYYIIFQIQIYAFNEMDSGEDISLDVMFNDGSKIDDKDGTLLKVAYLAKISHCYLQTLQEIINNHPKNSEYFEELYLNQFKDYATINGIDWNPLH